MESHKVTIDNSGTFTNTGIIGGTNNTVTNTNTRPETQQASLLISKNVSREAARNLIMDHRRYLEKLYEQEARFGINCPPYIKIEIEDRELAIQLLESATQ